jgi:catechol 2,3-dioxygenase-like lactoylglutathione lyase family enzyme
MIKQINHVQVCIPPNCEEEARRFYIDVLQLDEIAKPPALVKNGGFWLQLPSKMQVHVGIDAVTQRTKAHICFEVDDLRRARAYLRSHRVRFYKENNEDENDIPGQIRFSIYDPFNNRIELVQVLVGSGDTSNNNSKHIARL